MALSVLGVWAFLAFVALLKGCWHICFEIRIDAKLELKALVAQLQVGVQNHFQFLSKILKNHPHFKKSWSGGLKIEPGLLQETIFKRHVNSPCRWVACWVFAGGFRCLCPGDARGGAKVVRFSEEHPRLTPSPTLGDSTFSSGGAIGPKLKHCWCVLCTVSVRLFLFRLVSLWWRYRPRMLT